MNEIPAYPNLRMNCVDIKDVSLAHLRALERPEAAGNRFIICQQENYALIEQA